MASPDPHIIIDDPDDDVAHGLSPHLPSFTLSVCFLFVSTHLTSPCLCRTSIGMQLLEKLISRARTQSLLLPPPTWIRSEPLALPPRMPSITTVVLHLQRIRG